MSEDIYHSTHFSYFTLKSFGLAFYRIDKKSKSFKTDIYHYLGLAVTVCLSFGITVSLLLSYQEDDFDSGVQSKLLDNLWKFQYATQQISAIFVLIFHFIKRSNMENFLVCVSEFDKNMDRLNWYFKRIHFRFILPICCGVSTSLLLIYEIIAFCILDIYGPFDNFSKLKVIVSFIFIIEFYLLLSLQFFMNTYYIKIRLKALRQHIR